MTPDLKTAWYRIWIEGTDRHTNTSFIFGQIRILYFGIAEQTGEKFGQRVSATCDAKYLEVGISCKSDNVDVFLERFKAEGITAEDCSFWGDEFVEIEHELYGSDSFMYTEKSKAGDFFDVSAIEGNRPEAVKVLGGGVETFLTFLKEQA